MLQLCKLKDVWSSFFLNFVEIKTLSIEKSIYLNFQICACYSEVHVYRTGSTGPASPVSWQVSTILVAEVRGTFISNSHANQIYRYWKVSTIQHVCYWEILLYLYLPIYEGLIDTFWKIHSLPPSSYQRIKEMQPTVYSNWSMFGTHASKTKLF